MWQLCFLLLLPLLRAADFLYNIGSSDICLPTRQTSQLQNTPQSNQFQGSAVAISRDHTYTIVGAAGNLVNSALVGGFFPYIYQPSLDTYIDDGDPGQSIRSGSNSMGSSYQGLSLAISDEETLAVGGPGDNVTLAAYFVGAVWIFKRNATDPKRWIQKGEKLVGPHNVTQVDSSNVFHFGGGQGWDVALSGSGNILAYSAVNEATEFGSYVGAVWIWTRPSPTQDYVYQTKLIGERNYSAFGWAFELSLDGSILAVGATESDNPLDPDSINYRAVYIYTHPANNFVVWTLVQSKLKSPSLYPGFAVVQAFFLDLSDDGRTLAFAGAAPNQLQVAVPGIVTWIWVIDENTGNFVEVQEITAGSVGWSVAINSQTGTAVALSGDGQVLAIGGQPSSPLGGVNLYTRTVPSPNHPLFIPGTQGCNALNVIGSPSTVTSLQGSSLALDEDGTYMIEGGPILTSTGYSLTGSAWTFTQNVGINGSYTDCFSDESAESGNPLYFQISCPLDVYYTYPSLHCDSDRQGPFPLTRDACFQSSAFKQLPTFTFLNVHCACPKGKYNDAQGNCIAQTPTAIQLLVTVVGAKSYLASNQNLIVTVSNIPAGGSLATGIVTFKFQNADKNLGMVPLVSGKATFLTIDLPVIMQGPLTLNISYEGDNTHLPASATFDVIFYRFPTGGAYLVDLAHVNTPNKIGTVITFYGIQGAWSAANPAFNHSILPFNGWTPNKNLALKCLTTFSVSKSDNIQKFRFIGVVAVNSIGTSDNHMSSIQKIAIVDTNGQAGGQGKLLAVVCPATRMIAVP